MLLIFMTALNSHFENDSYWGISFGALTVVFLSPEYVHI